MVNFTFPVQWLNTAYLIGLYAHFQKKKKKKKKKKQEKSHKWITQELSVQSVQYKTGEASHKLTDVFLASLPCSTNTVTAFKTCDVTLIIY